MEKDNGELEQMSREQAADLARLEAMAADGEPEAGAGQEPEQAGPVVSTAESLAGLLGMVAAGAGLFGYKKTADLWRPETCQAVADKAVPVLQKYAWGQRIIEFLDTGAGVEEMALAGVVVPLALATVQTIQADRAAMQPQDEDGQDNGQARPAVAAVLGTPGTGEFMAEVNGQSGED